MIPSKFTGRPRQYNWSRLEKVNGWIQGDSRETLLRCAKSYFGRRKKNYTFTTRKIGDGFRIYRVK